MNYWRNDQALYENMNLFAWGFLQKHHNFSGSSLGSKSESSSSSAPASGILSSEDSSSLSLGSSTFDCSFSINTK